MTNDRASMLPGCIVAMSMVFFLMIIVFHVAMPLNITIFLQLYDDTNDVLYTFSEPTMISRLDQTASWFYACLGVLFCKRSSRVAMAWQLVCVCLAGGCWY